MPQTPPSRPASDLGGVLTQKEAPEDVESHVVYRNPNCRECGWILCTPPRGLQGCQYLDMQEQVSRFCHL